MSLLNITAENLLEKFGAGSHKPGSGSAAAFQGLLSSKLLVTVISITNQNNHRYKYEQFISELLKMSSEISNTIFPQLVQLFDQDSVQFGRTIDIRSRRDIEKDPYKKSRLERRSLEELKESIQIPLKIADLMIKLCEIGEFVFDNGFRSARGDTQVALNGAVSGLMGCISIIQLNLLSFKEDHDEFRNTTGLEVERLKRQHYNFNGIANDKMEILANELKAKCAFYGNLNALIFNIRSYKITSNSSIEENVVALQRLIWKSRSVLWKDETIDNPLTILNPSKIFKKALGYNYDDKTALEIDYTRDLPFEVAGIIDQQNKVVQISNHLSQDVKNFTAAHELGHAFFHTQSVMHRDMPLDGSLFSGMRNKEEQVADKFATYFLMPKKLIRQFFEDRFFTAKFTVNQETTFKLTGGDITRLRRECKNLRGLSRKLASANFYEIYQFKSLAEIFGVSVEAMAIRLEELRLVEF